MKTLVLGLGNPILSDDGVGIHVVRAAASRMRRDGVTFAEASVGGLRLLEVIVGCDQLILVDAIMTRDGEPGQVFRLAPDDVRTSRHAGSTHDLSFHGALAWGRHHGLPLPDDAHILIVAVEVQDPLTFGEVCSPAVEAAIPRAADVVLEALGASGCVAE